MKYVARVVILGVTALLLYLDAPSLLAESINATGWVSDTLCGAKGVNALHLQCARRNVASGKAKYALYDEARKKLYILEPQETAAAYAGQRVKVTGTLSFSPLERAGESLDTKTSQVVTHAKALDSSTPIGGILTISTVEVASPPATR